MRLRKRSESEAPQQAPAAEPQQPGVTTMAGRRQAPLVEAPREAPVAAASGSRREAASAGRQRRAWRTRDAAAGTVGAVGSGVIALARLVMSAASLIALLIALAIVLRDVDANGANSIVKGIHEGANFFAGSFTGLIEFSGHPKRAITIDWGIAVLAYLLVGSIISRFIAGLGRGGLRFERSHRTAPTL